MTEFASEHLQHQEVIESGGSISIPFGPPTPGTIIVFLEAHGLLFAAPPQQPQNTTPAQPGMIIARMNDNRFHRAGVGALGVFDPGGGFDPPPPSPPVDLNVLLDALARVIRRHYESRWPGDVKPKGADAPPSGCRSRGNCGSRTPARSRRVLSRS